MLHVQQRFTSSLISTTIFFSVFCGIMVIVVSTHTKKASFESWNENPVFISFSILSRPVCGADFEEHQKCSIGGSSRFLLYVIISLYWLRFVALGFFCFQMVLIYDLFGCYSEIFRLSFFWERKFIRLHVVEASTRKNNWPRHFFLWKFNRMYTFFYVMLFS